MTVRVKAIYQDGVFVPLELPDVPESQEVELSVSWPTSTGPSNANASFASLRGIWSHISDDELNQMEDALGEMRKQTESKLESLAEEMAEIQRD